MISLNMVWPAMYVAEELVQFWFLVFATIVIETITIKIMLKYSLKKSIKASLIANLVSGSAGLILLVIGMLPIGMVVGSITIGLLKLLHIPLAHEIIHNIDWITTYIIMCLGSIAIEIIIIKLIYKDTIKRLLFPLMIGNLLTYSFIAYSMTNEKKALSKKRTETVFYYPTESHITFADSTKLYIHKAKTTLYFNDNNEILNKKLPLIVFYKSSNSQKFQFELSLSQIKSIEKKDITKSPNNSSDTLKIILKQITSKHKHDHSTLVINDTILFVGPDKITNKAENYPEWQ